MSNLDIVRAWKDEEYRLSLSEEVRAQLPENPAGLIELSESDMQMAAGGRPGASNLSTWITVTCGFLCYTKAGCC